MQVETKKPIVLETNKKRRVSERKPRSVKGTITGSFKSSETRSNKSATTTSNSFSFILQKAKILLTADPPFEARVSFVENGQSDLSFYDYKKEDTNLRMKRPSEKDKDFNNFYEHGDFYAMDKSMAVAVNRINTTLENELLEKFNSLSADEMRQMIPDYRRLETEIRHNHRVTLADLKKIYMNSLKVPVKQEIWKKKNLWQMKYNLHTQT